jgi:peptidoglycan/LPS O-acetylase OafA/YrhL
VTALRYRADIDGLRAIAVLAVLLFHGELGCTGGYVGVDVFFVISGFLITSLIWRDLETGRFSFAHFWERRARRIIPAMVAVAVFTLAAGWFVLLPDDLESLGRAAAALAAFGANVYYWQATGYFDGAAQEKPLLHTWSLAVEEQFYFCVPFLFWALYRSVGLGRRRTVANLTGLGLAASLVLSIYGVARFPSATFYLLPTRAWELLLGSLVALVPPPPGLARRRALREGLAGAGLLLVLAPVFAYVETTPFPGLAALPPCLGTALIIRANEREEDGPETAVARFLSLGPMVFVGSISYSLYLLHWPVLAFARYLGPAPLALSDRALLLGLGLVLAYLSYRFVETPFRTRALGSSRGAMFAYAGAGLAVVLAGGGLFVAQGGFPRRLPAQSLEYASVRSDRTYIHELSLEDVRAGNLVPLGATAPGRPPSLLVWGDSHAMAAIPAFHALLEERGLAGRAATHSSTAPVLGWHLERTEWGLRQESRPYNQAVLAYVRRRSIPDVVLCARWSMYAGCGLEGSGPFGPALVSTVRQLAAGGSRAWILLDVPGHAFDVPAALARAVLSGRDLGPYCARPESTPAFDGFDPALVEAVRAAGGRFIDPKPGFLHPVRGHYVVEAGGAALYRDEGHLTREGARLVLLPLLREALPLAAGDR